MSDFDGIDRKIKITADVADALAGVNALGGSFDLLSGKIKDVVNGSHDEFRKLAQNIAQAGNQIGGLGMGPTGIPNQPIDHTPYYGPQGGSFSHDPRIMGNTGYNQPFQAPPQPQQTPTPPPDPLTFWQHLKQQFAGGPSDPHKQTPSYKLGGGLPFDEGEQFGRQAGEKFKQHAGLHDVAEQLGQQVKGLVQSTGPGGYMAGTMMGAAFSNPATAAITVIGAAMAPAAMAVGQQFAEYDERHTGELQYAQRVGFDPKLMEQGGYYEHFAEEGFKPLEANMLLEASRANALSIQQLNESIDSAKALGVDANAFVQAAGQAKFNMGADDMRQFGADMQAGARDMGGMTASRTPEFMAQQLAIAETFANAFNQKLEGEDRKSVHTAQKYLQSDDYFQDNLGAQTRVLKSFASPGGSVDPRSDFQTFSYLRAAGIEAEDLIYGMSPEDKMKALKFNEEELDRQFGDEDSASKRAARAMSHKQLSGAMGMSARDLKAMSDLGEKHGWNTFDIPKGEIEAIEEGKMRHDSSRAGMSDRTQAELADNARGIADSMHSAYERSLKYASDTIEKTADDIKTVGELAGKLMGPMGDMIESVRNLVAKLDNLATTITDPEKTKDAVKGALDESADRERQRAREWGEAIKGGAEKAGEYVLGAPAEAAELPPGELPPSERTHAPSSGAQAPSSTSPRRPQVPNSPDAVEAEEEWTGSGTVAQPQQQGTSWPTDFKHKWSPEWKQKLRSAAQKNSVPLPIVEGLKLQETGIHENKFPVGDKKYGGSYGPFQYLQAVHGKVDDEKQADIAAKQLRQRYDRLKSDAAKAGFKPSEEQLWELAATGHNASGLGSLAGVNQLRKEWYNLPPAKSWQEVRDTAHRVTEGADPRPGHSYMTSMESRITPTNVKAMSPKPKVPKPKTNMVPVPKPSTGPITSGFGPRKHPVTGEEGKMHYGVDFAVPQGTPIKSPLDGTVVSAGEMDGYGNYILVDHGDGVRTGYAHMSDMDVKAGQKIKAGTQIGLSGGAEGTPGAGTSTGPHLHWEVSKNGVRIDPLKAKIPAPVKAKPKQHHHDGDGHAHMDPVPRRQNVPMPQPSRPQGLGLVSQQNSNDLLGGLMAPIGSNIPGYDMVMSGGLLPKPGEGQGDVVRTPDFNPTAGGKLDPMMILGGLLGGLGMAAMGGNPSTELEDKNSTNRAIRETADNTREMRDYAREGRTPGINPNADLPGGKRRGPLGDSSSEEQLQEASQKNSFSKFLNDTIGKLTKGDVAGAAADAGGAVKDKIMDRVPDALKPVVGPALDKAGGAIMQAGQGVFGQLGAGLAANPFGALAVGGIVAGWGKNLYGILTGKEENRLQFEYEGEQFKPQNEQEEEQLKQGQMLTMLSQMPGGGIGVQASASAAQDVIRKQIAAGRKASRPDPTLSYDEHGMVTGVKPSPMWGVDENLEPGKGLVSKGRSHNESEKDIVPDLPGTQQINALKGLAPPKQPKVESVNGQVRGYQSGATAGNKYVANVSNNINVGGQGGSGDPGDTARLVAAVRSGTYAAMQEHERRFSRQIDYN